MCLKTTHITFAGMKIGTHKIITCSLTAFSLFCAASKLCYYSCMFEVSLICD